MKISLSISRFLALLILLSFAFACSKDEDDPGLDENFQGSFEFSISGDDSFTLAGEAFFDQVIINGGTAGAQGTSLSIIFTQDDENSVVLSLVKANTDGFGEGTYSFIEDPEDDQVFFSVAFYSETSQTSYFITSGSVSFNSVKENLIEGNINVTMTNFMENNISLAGTFKARGLSLIYGK
jgi:hypothetical protein